MLDNFVLRVELILFLYDSIRSLVKTTFRRRKYRFSPERFKMLTKYLFDIKLY